MFSAFFPHADWAIANAFSFETMLENPL